MKLFQCRLTELSPLKAPLAALYPRGLFSNLYQEVNVTAAVILRIINVAIQFA